jgi:predicted RNase H-like HicB family nuclease
MATKNYFAIADRMPGERRHSIIFPAFPGVTSVADILPDVITQASDALATAVADMEADGETLPPAVEDGGDVQDLPPGLHNPILLMVPVEVKTRSVRVNVSLDEGLLARMDAVAVRTGTSRSALLAKGAKLVIAAEAANL